MLMREPIIGEIISLVPGIHTDRNDRQGEPLAGEVVYINHDHRIFTAEFTFPNGWSFRESFKFILPEDIAIKPYQSGGAHHKGPRFWDERRLLNCPTN